MLVGYAYAAVVAVGGIMGYAKAGSMMSLAAGVGCGSLAAFGSYQASHDPSNVYVLMGTSGLLTGVMGSRFLKSGKVMPAGLITVLSLSMLFYCGYRLFSSNNTPEKSQS